MRGSRGRAGRWGRPSPHLLFDSSTQEKRAALEELWVLGAIECSSPPLRSPPGGHSINRICSPRCLPLEGPQPRHTHQQSAKSALGPLRTAAGPLALAGGPAPRPSTAASAFSPEAGYTLQSHRTVPGATTPPGVQTGGCCPASGRGMVERQTFLGWEKGRGQQRGSLACFRSGGGRRKGLGAQPAAWLPHPVTYTFLTHITLKHTQDTSSRGRSPHPHSRD